MHCARDEDAQQARAHLRARALPSARNRTSVIVSESLSSHASTIVFPSYSPAFPVMTRARPRLANAFANSEIIRGGEGVSEGWIIRARSEVRSIQRTNPRTGCAARAEVALMLVQRHRPLGEMVSANVIWEKNNRTRTVVYTFAYAKKNEHG